MKKAKLTPSVKRKSKNSAEHDNKQSPPSRRHKMQLRSRPSTSSLEDKGQSSAEETKKTASTSEENLDYFSRLPMELILKIFSFLDTISLGRCGLVSRTFNKATLDPLIFRDVYVTVANRKVNPKLLQFLIKRCKVVRKADFPGAYSLDRECPRIFLQFLQESCQGIKILRMRYSKLITVEVLKQIGLCEHLTILYLCHAPHISSWVPSAMKLTKLLKLDVAVTDVSNEILIPILKANPNLWDLETCHCVRLELDGIAETLAENNKNLTVWNAQGIRTLTLVGAEHISKIAKLSSLAIENVARSGSNYWLENIILGCPSLNRLSLERFYAFNDDELFPILLSRKFLYLSFNASEITESQVETILVNIKSLRELDITNCRLLSAAKMQEWTRKYPKMIIQCKPFEVVDLFLNNPFRQVSQPPPRENS